MNEESQGNNFSLNQYRSSHEQGDSHQDSPFYQSAAPAITLPKGGAAIQENHFTHDAIDDTDYLFYHLRVAFSEKAWQLHPENSPAKVLYNIKELLQEVNQAVAIDFTTKPEAGEKRLLSFNKTLFYNNLATHALAEGMVESLAIPYESYSLAFTPDILTQSYGARVDNTMFENGGYVDLENDGNYWLPSGKAIYENPLNNFYTAQRFLDPWGNATVITYWSNYWLLPQSVKDAKDNINSILAYDWHNLQPLTMQDANDNVTEMYYDALGLAVAMAVKGKDDGTQGDTLEGLEIDSDTDLQLQEDFWNHPENYAPDLLEGATWRCIYDLESTPVAVAMVGREEHHYESLGLPVKTLIQFVYSDGLGREIMQKVQCEPFFNNEVDKGATLSLVEGWIGTGRTIYNNKGKPVMQFEPYFSDSHHCDTAEQAAADGVSPKLYYDPLERNYRTDLPDGSFTKTAWTAWEQQIWDNNDTVLESAWYLARKDGQMGVEEKDAAEKTAAHANTPTIIHVDTLARGFYTIQLPLAEALEAIHSYEVLDIQSNRLSVVDGRGLTPLQYRHNMLQASCLQISTDSGTQRTLLDVAGQPLYTWDAEDRKTEIEYDELRRSLKRITDGRTLEKYIYGEGISDDKEKNLRGQLYQHYDGSGLQQINAYDFKGNPLVTEQQLLDDATISDADWSLNPSLSTKVFTSIITYDALNRPVTQTDPGGNIHEFTYDKGGFLKKVKLNTDEYVNDIHYDAKGQRQAIWYGNGTKTSYTYDEFTFRLRRLLTVNLNNNEILQDLNYWYDPVGNITELQDHAQQTIFFNNSVVSPTQAFIYDALYRLIEASGRELIGTATFGAEDNWNDAAWQTTHKGDSNAIQNYTQLYTYDAVGNILELQHIATAGSYTRTYAIATDSNQLLSTTVGSATYTYQYDARGNMATMPHLDGMHWNLNNELHQIENGTMQAYYQYSGGQRIRKYVDKGSIKEERIYLGSYEIYRKFDSTSSLIIGRTTVHVSDDAGRIAMLETRTVGDAIDDHGTAEELTRYIYSNHLQSASLELDESGSIISYEEYHPYGTTSYQAMNTSIHAVAKRYRYTGKERDEESGLYTMGARFYICWLGRWASPDPINSEWYNLTRGEPDRNLKRTHTELSASPYEYCYDNPVIYNDISGEQPPPKKGEIGINFEYQAPLVVDHAQDVRGKPIIIPQTTEKHPYSKGEYIVREKDTLTGISKKLGVSIDDLATMNNIEDRNKLQIGQILKVAPERDFSNNPRGGYSNPNNSVGIEYTVDNMFSAGAQFFYGLGSENMIIVAGKSLDALRKWERVQDLVNEGTAKLWEDGKLTPGETFRGTYESPNIPTWLENQMDDNLADEKFISPQHVIGSFNFSMRVNADGRTATVAVYDSKSISSLSDNFLGQDANRNNNSSNGRRPFSTQYIRFIWKINIAK